MPADLNQVFWQEAEGASVSFSKTGPTTGTITWAYQTPIQTVTGAVVTLSNKALNPSNYPTDSIRYTAQPDIDQANSTTMIGSAFVVAFTVDDVTTTTINVVNLTPNVDYYVGLYPHTNVTQYYTPGVTSYQQQLSADAYATDLVTASSPPLNPILGAVYFDQTMNAVQMWNGSSWIAAGTNTVYTGIVFPVPGQAPYNYSEIIDNEDVGDLIYAGMPLVVGDFFYHKTQKQLYVYTAGAGNGWALTSQSAAVEPTYNKVGVGTDGSFDEREKLMTSIKALLGWPVFCTELKTVNFNEAIDLALSTFRAYADNAYEQRYVLLRVRAGQDMYYLNDPVLESNRIVDVLKIHRLSNLGLFTLGENAIYGQAFLDQLYSGGSIDLVSIHLVAAMAESFSLIFAGDISFKWHETRRELQLWRKIYADETVIIETMMEKTEQELITDRYAGLFIKKWALAECKGMLGQIRGKYQSLPGPNGGLSLNGSELMSQAETEKMSLMEGLVQNYEYGNGTESGSWSFLMG